VKYLSIDPATATGKKQAYASFEDRKIVSRGRCTLDEVQDLIKGHDVIFCEDQYIAFPKGGRSRIWRAKAQSIISLAHSVGQIERMAKFEDKEFYYVDPGTWQARVLGVRPGTKAHAREQAAVKIARMYIKTHLGKEESEKRMGVDIGCAVCIGICGIGEREYNKLKLR